MRISQEKLDFIAKEIKLYVPNSTLYLFGSRVDNNKKGGDIDILVLSDTKLVLADKLKIKRKFYNKFGEQRIDILTFTFSEKNPFKDLILSQEKIEF